MVAIIIIPIVVVIIILLAHLKTGESLQVHYLPPQKQFNPGPDTPQLSTSERKRRQLESKSLV